MMKTLQLNQQSLQFNRGISKQCMLCTKQFKIINSQHVCKRCFRSVCGSCSTTKTKVYRQDKKSKNHRLCDVCKTESLFLNKYVAKFKLRFLKDSDFAKTWSTKMISGNILIQPRNEGNYSKQIINKFWSSLNFSLRQFIGIVISDTGLDVQIFLKKVSSLINKISVKQSIQSIDDIIYLSIFIACHCSECNSIKIVFRIIDIFSHHKISQQNILKYLRLQLVNSQINHISQYISNNFKKLQHNLGVNLMTAEVSLLVINNVLCSDFPVQQYEMAIAAYLFTSKDIICSDNNIHNINLLMIKNTKYSKIDQTINFYRKLKKQPTLIQNVNENKPKDNDPDVLNRQTLKVQNKNLKKKQRQYLKHIKQLQQELKQSRQSICSTIQESSELDKQYSQNDQSQISILRSTIYVKNDQIKMYQKQTNDLKCQLQLTKQTMFDTLKKTTQNKNDSKYTSQCQTKQLCKQLKIAKDQQEAARRLNSILLGKLNELAKKITEIEGIRMQRNNIECQQQLIQNKVIIVQNPNPNEETGCLLF